MKCMELQSNSKLLVEREKGKQFVVIRLPIGQDTIMY